MFQKRRIRKYARVLDDTPLVASDSKRIVPRLAEVWRAFKITDLATIPATTQAITRVDVWIPNLPDLVQHFHQHNRFIAQENDDQITRVLVQDFTVKYTNTLEMFLADEHNLSIDVVASLIRLSGLLQEHHYLLKDKPNHYYQRMSEKYYEDIIVLTETLVSIALEQTMK